MQNYAVTVSGNALTYSGAYVAFQKVYGVKTGGGSVSDTGDVLWNGTPAFEVIITADPTPYSKLVVSFDANDDETFTGPFVMINNKSWFSEPNSVAALSFTNSAWRMYSMTNYITKVTGYK